MRIDTLIQLQARSLYCIVLYLFISIALFKARAIRKRSLANDSIFVSMTIVTDIVHTKFMAYRVDRCPQAFSFETGHFWPV